MTRTPFFSVGLGAIVALGLIGYACAPEKTTTIMSGTGGAGTGPANSGGATTTPGSSGGATTTPGSSGGATTTPGSSGGATTTPGSSGGATTPGSSGGATTIPGSGGAPITGLPICPSPAPDDKSACNGEPSCTKNCGVNLGSGVPRAQKACVCSGAPGTWACPSTLGACMYPPAANVACLRLPSPLPACPMDPTLTPTLIRSGTSTCPAPAAGACGMVCGSATAQSYQDSGGAPKIGYCTCIATGIWQCASVNEWPVVP